MLGNTIDVYFVCNGTAANVLCLSTLAKPYQGIICAESAHINVDECGAPEKYTGCKLLTIATADGKLTVESIKPLLANIGDQHKVQPKIISIAQGTELGTLYSAAEIKKITDFAHANGLLVHMDGSTWQMQWLTWPPRLQQSPKMPELMYFALAAPKME